MMDEEYTNTLINNSFAKLATNPVQSDSFKSLKNDPNIQHFLIHTQTFK